MKLQRTKNATRNIIFGIIVQIYNLAVPFLLRTALVYYLGIEYLGLNSLFASVLQVLNLAELGVGSAMVFSMYKPIAMDDKETICRLMNLYKKYYRIIGSVILVVGIAITPAIPYIIEGDIPKDLNIYILYWLNLATTVMTYWLFAYKNSLLTAFQRIDITSKINLLVKTITYLVQFFILYSIKNYYAFIIAALATQIFNNVITAFVVSKMYPEYSAHGEVDTIEKKRINQRVKDLFTARIGGVITNSMDTIVISMFLGLTVLAIYQNYFYIVSSIIGFATIVYSACMAGIGNSIITETEEKNYKDFETMIFIVAWCVSICTCCLLNMFQPFMKMWMGQENMLKMSAVVCFCLYFIVYEFNAVLNLFKDAAGIWHQDRFRPLVVSLVNLLLNLATVQYWGIYGVLMSTVISMSVIGVPWIVNNLFNNLYNRNQKCDFVKKMVKYVFEIILISIISYLICDIVKVEGILGLVIRAIICLTMSNMIFVMCNIRTKEFDFAKQLVFRVLKRQ
jgi:O-antigen/teichoic acid export membrane protein